MKPQTLLRLYPTAWRERYGDEFVALLEQEGTGSRVVVNVMAGAFDAWMSPKGRVEMAFSKPLALKVLPKVDTKKGKYESDWWLYMAGALVFGLVVHGVGQLIHPGRMFPISFLAGFMSAFQLWNFRQYSLRTRAAAAFLVFVIMTAVVWLFHFSLHEFVYPRFGQ